MITKKYAAVFVKALSNYHYEWKKKSYNSGEQAQKNGKGEKREQRLLLDIKNVADFSQMF